MNEINWDDLRLFLAVAKAGGLGGAAKKTGASAPTLGRHMLALEQNLCRELFIRKPRGYDLTEDGLKLLADVENIESRIDDLINKGGPLLVKISAGTWVTSVLLKSIKSLQLGPSIKLRFEASEQITDIGRREALIGVRNQRPTGLGLACRKIGQVRFAIYAKNHEVMTWAHVLSTTPSANWVSKNIQGNPVIEVTKPESALDLALSGAARIVLPTFIGDGTQGLIPVSDHIEELAHDQWLVTHHEDRFQPDVRNLIDRIHRVLRSECCAVISEPDSK